MVRGILGCALLLAAVKLHHHFHGPPFDYAGLALAAGASFFGVPGPGEPVLIAAGILAAKHKLDIVEVILVAWAGANGGGVAGWLLGRLGGRRLVTFRGPLHGFRRNALEHGELLFDRHAVLAVLLTPSWVAGIHRMTPQRYLAINAIIGAIWATAIGLGAFYAGPVVVDLVADAGLVTGSLLGVAVILVVGGALLRRRRHRRRAEPG